MSDLASRIANLPPEKRKQLEEKLKEKQITILEDIDLSKLTTSNSRKHTPIEPAVEREYYPLSSAQRGLFILNQYGNAGIIPFAGIIEGELEVARFEAAFKKLVQRHEAFRASFELINGEPAQKIHPETDFNLQYFPIAPGAIADHIQEFFQPFEVSQAPLLKVGLFPTSPNQHLLLLSMHHLIADGASLTILLREFNILYQGGKLPELRVQYKDYAVWQNEFIKTPAFQEQEKYWLERFPDEIPILNLPLDYGRADDRRKNLSNATVDFTIAKETVAQLDKLAKDRKVSHFTLLLAIYTLFLHKYSDQEEMVIGTVNAGRQNADLENMIGMLIKVIPLKIEVNPELSFFDYLESVQQTCFTAFENQDYPFENLMEKLPGERRHEMASISNVQFIFHNESENNVSANPGGIKISRYPFEVATVESAQLDLYLDILLGGAQEFHCIFGYNPNLFRPETPSRMIRHLTNLIGACAAQPGLQIKDLKMLSPDEIEQIIAFNYKGTNYPQGQTIHTLFNEQAERTPERIAVQYQGKQLTYRELNHRSNQLAHLLRQKGVGREDLVGIMAERSLEMLIGILGVLKAGGAYLPLDPGYPGEHLQYMLEDSNAKLLLIQAPLAGKVTGAFETVILEETGVSPADDSNPSNVNVPTDLAYLIYTSGSTGKPKGVMIEHRNVVSYVSAFNDEFGLTMDDVVLQQASASFDVFVEEVFPVLLRGGKLLIIPRSQVLDPALLARTLQENQVTLISCSPLLLNELNQLPLVESIHTFISGGDVLKSEFISNLVKKAKVYNTYGPTETTVCATYHRCGAAGDEATSHPPIGKPILNYRVYILDCHQNILPVGIPGEICISGEGLARGYFNRRELTQTKFVANPYLPGQKMYRTGDRGRWRPDGEIEFLGRLDEQVKIRGYRIEPGEIESRLLKHEMVKEAVVISREDPSGVSYLCAYVVMDGLGDSSILEEFLGKELPGYMIPSYIIRLEQMPLTPNGKINRKLLPNPTRSGRELADYVPPANEVEAKLAALWQEVLQTERISVTEDFFKLGGNSLKVIVIVSRIRKEFNVEVAINELFETPTIRAIATRIAGAGQTRFSAIEPAPESPFYPASSVQKRLYTIYRLEPNNLTYNIPVLMLTSQELDRAKLENSAQALLKRHEALRTSFQLNEGELIQLIHPNPEFKINFYEADEPELPGIAEGFIQPFDLNKAPLFRMSLVKLQGNRQLIMMDIHHIISDETSIQVIMRDFIRIYQGQELTPLRIQYKDFTLWQNRFFETEAFQKQESYWRQCFSSPISTLHLPLDYPRPQIFSFDGDVFSFEADAETTGEIKQLASQTGATVFMVLLAAYQALLANLTCDEDIVTGIPVTGRTHSDLADLVGMFVNTLPVRSYPAGTKSFLEFLLEVKVNLLQAYENQDYPLEMLLDNLDLPRNTGRNPLFDTMFAFRDLKSNGNVTFPELGFRPYPVGNKTAKFDLSLFAMENETNISFSFEYGTRLFQETTIRKFAEHYLSILKTVVRNTKVPINELGIQAQYETIDLGEVEFNF